MTESAIDEHIIQAGNLARRQSQKESLTSLESETEGLFDVAYTDAKKEVVAEFTVKYLNHQLRVNGGNISRAAKASGMLRPNFKRLMKQYGIQTGVQNES